MSLQEGTTFLWHLHVFVGPHSSQPLDRCSPRSLVEYGHVLLCRELAGITHRYWHVENVCFRACDQERAVVDHVLCVWARSWRLMWGLWYYAFVFVSYHYRTKTHFFRSAYHAFIISPFLLQCYRSLRHQKFGGLASNIWQASAYPFSSMYVVDVSVWLRKMPWHCWHESVTNEVIFFKIIIIIIILLLL